VATEYRFGFHVISFIFHISTRRSQGLEQEQQQEIFIVMSLLNFILYFLSNHEIYRLLNSVTTQPPPHPFSGPHTRFRLLNDTPTLVFDKCTPIFDNCTPIFDPYAYSTLFQNPQHPPFEPTAPVSCATSAGAAGSQDDQQQE